MEESINESAPKKVKIDYDFDLMKRRLCDLPEEIRSKETEIFAAQTKMDDLNAQMKSKELFMFREVSSETKEDGKPKYTNESMRDAETQKRLSTDLEFSALLKGSLEYSKVKGLAAIELDYYKRELKVIELLLKAFEVEKGVR